MMTATMDLMAMYKYDPTLFDDIVIPSGVNKDTLIKCLIMDTAEMEVIYPRPDFLKMALTTWSYKQLPVWTKLYESTMFDYNPIWNKDGTISETITRDLKGTEDTTTNIDRVDNLEDKNTRNFEDKNTRNFEDKNTRNFEDKETKDLDGDNTESVYGFNSSTAAPANKNEYNDNGTDTINHTGTDTYNHTGTDTYNHTGTDTYAHTGRQDLDTTVDRDTTDTGTIKTQRTEKGNIGVTSTQQLIKEEREIDQFNIYDYIINDFRQRFCLALY